MLILTIRTDKPEAEIGLYEDDIELTCHKWQAHRQLAETIHKEIKGVLDKEGKKLQDLEGVVIYQGPGSFTGLRIGISVANALANSLAVPVVGTKSEDWIKAGVNQLNQGINNQIVMPFYGSEAKTTLPRK